MSTLHWKGKGLQMLTTYTVQSSQDAFSRQSLQPMQGLLAYRTSQHQEVHPPSSPLCFNLRQEWSSVLSSKPAQGRARPDMVLGSP